MKLKLENDIGKIVRLPATPSQISFANQIARVLDRELPKSKTKDSYCRFITENMADYDKWVLDERNYVESALECRDSEDFIIDI